MDGTGDLGSLVLRGAGQLRSQHQHLGGALVAAADLDAALLGGPDVGVRAAQHPAGALGAWTSLDSPAICIPDGTRRLDLVSALKALDERLPNRGPIVVGLGLHRRMTEAELSSIAGFEPIQHDPDDVSATSVVDGIQGAVSRPVAESPYAIAVGVVELHQYAGVSGGHKAVAVGCGGRQTIAALHHRDRILAPQVEIGRIAGNPFRATIEALGEAARCRLALVWVPAVGVWMFGSPKAVVRAALRRMDPWIWQSRRAPGAILEVSEEKAISLYQASRAASYLALSPRPPLSEGATIVLRAACPDGLGAEAGFVQALHDHRPPWTALLEGPPPAGAGAQRAVILALMARRYRLVVEGCQDPAPFRDVGIEAHTVPSERPATWLRVARPFQQIPQLAAPPAKD